MSADTELLTKLRKAVAAANLASAAVDKAVEMKQSRSKELGALLLEAKKVHRTAEAFKAFLERVPMKLAQAYVYLRIVEGRTTEEEVKQDARERKQKSREKARSSKPHSPAPTPVYPKPEMDSVTPSVTESSEPKPAAPDPTVISAGALAAFKQACLATFAQMTVGDLKRAAEFAVTTHSDFVQKRRAAA